MRPSLQKSFFAISIRYQLKHLIIETPLPRYITKIKKCTIVQYIEGVNVNM